MEEEWKLQHAGRLGYLDSISEFIDFRKVRSPTEHVLRNLAITEVHLKKARRSISRMMRLQWVRDLDIETLEAKGHWATMAELVENILKSCRSNPETASPLDLSFATRFVAVYLFVKVKGSRLMTYQYLKVEMVEKAKKNGGFVDQKNFKTASKYGFDSLILSASSLRILESYISDIRPLLKPRCDYVLVTRSGAQFTKFSNLMSKLVYDSIGKYVHPTRLRQIIETESSISLDRSEQEIISEDQKHSSVVAKVHNKKRRSRDIATKAHECLKRLQGETGSQLEETILSTILTSSDSSDRSVAEETNSVSEVEGFCQALVNEKTYQQEDTENVIENERVQSSHSSSKKPMKFSKEEDANLKEGLRRHGFGHWTAMIRDKELTFQRGRTADSIKKEPSVNFQACATKLIIDFNRQFAQQSEHL